MSILTILDQLSSTRSKLEKIDILEKNKDNEVLKKVFLTAYDPMVSYYMKKLPVYRDDEPTCDWEDVFDILNQLSMREVSGNTAKVRLANVLSSVDSDTREVVGRILNRDLRVGCSASTANKVWPGLIGKYPCMLCESFSEKNLERVKFPALVQTKCDGMRVNFVVKNGAIDIFGRSGKPINIFGAIDNSILNLCIQMDVIAGVFDGELLVIDDHGNILPRAIGNGILNKAIKGTITKEQSQNVIVTLWDFIPSKEFSSVKNAKGTTPYSERWYNLQESVDFLELWNVLLPDSLEVVNLDEAKHFYTEQLAKGREGAVLKSLDGVWENRRSRSQVKLKVENEVELLVIGKNEGTGRLENNLGSLVCVTHDAELEVNVSGFTDKQREYYWMSQDIIGSIITVKANDYQKSEGRETLSLFLPVFVEERLDKNKANTTKEIVASFDKIYGR